MCYINLSKCAKQILAHDKGAVIMKYQNPILRGFYPDPSVCKANDKYYMVTSTMQYFPGVPLFESNDLVNWKQIGHCLTRPSQVALESVDSSGGVFAPCIRYHEGVFYMTTTNSTTGQNFYVWTTDIESEWSEPIYVDQGGIDPSFYFEDSRVFFMSNGEDEDHVPGIVQCEINIKTGEKLSPSKTIWQGSGGRYLEGPHLYKINNLYYLLAAEGGTEYGHMVTYARSKSIFGPFESYPQNPVLTNRNLGGFFIQGVGHGDLIQAPDGSFYLIHLGFRQTGRWTCFHHLGREVFISKITFDEKGWFQAGENGTTTEYIELNHVTYPQLRKEKETFENTDWNLDWCYLRKPNPSYDITAKNRLTLYGSPVSLNEAKSPTFLGIRQKDFCMNLHCNVSINYGEAGISIYMDENHHYDLLLKKVKQQYQAQCSVRIGNIETVVGKHKLSGISQATFLIESDSQEYSFYIQQENEKILLGKGLTRYLSSEVAGGFTGVMIGLYAYSKKTQNKAIFEHFSIHYQNEN